VILLQNNRLLHYRTNKRQSQKNIDFPTSDTVETYGVKGLKYLGAETVIQQGTNIDITQGNKRIDSNWNWEEYIRDDVKVNYEENHKYADQRRGVSAQSAYYNIFGLPRTGFDQHSIDIIRKNPYYLLMETAFCNYLRSITFDVKDGHGEHVDEAYNILKNPNPQEGFWDCFIPMIRDLLAYDSGVIVKTFSRGGWLKELRAYPGPQFWGEIDRTFFDDLSGSDLPNFGGASSTYISNGYITRYWQHTSVGLFIPFKPEEICYFMQYPQSGSIYGSDIMRYFRYHYRYLMSSTVAAGKIMDNGLVTNLVFKHPDIGTIQTLKQRLDATKQVNQGSDNFGKTLHLIGNEDVATVSNTLMDMEWLNGQQFIFKIVMNIFGFPASEFSMDEGNASRSSAYVQRNIMRTRMLATILSLLEDKINREILPFIKGYDKEWNFTFQRSVDLDDLIKETHITNQRASSFSIFVNEGVPPVLALKLAGLGKELTPEERDMLSDEMTAIAEAMGASSTTARYAGDQYNEAFLGYEEKNSVVNDIRMDKSPTGGGDYN